MADPAALHRLFESLHLSRRFVEARPVAEDEFAAAVEAFGPRHPAVVRARFDQAMAAQAAGDEAAAAALEREGRDMLEALRRQADADPRHPASADFLLFEAEVLAADPTQKSEVGRRLEAAQKIREERFGPDDPLVAEVLVKRGELEYVSGELERAVPLYRWAVLLLRKSSALQEYTMAQAVHGLALALAELGRHEEASPFFEEAAALQQGPSGDRRKLYFLLMAWAEMLEKTGKVQEAGARRCQAENLLPRGNPGAQGYRVT